ncbi:hypothetical protein I4U23_005046 [Adineta vaga]|nr:hypothetical protein I4U23_005046 [Adineta vaga]
MMTYIYAARIPIRSSGSQNNSTSKIITISLVVGIPVLFCFISLILYYIRPRKQAKAQLIRPVPMNTMQYPLHSAYYIPENPIHVNSRIQ